MPIALLLPLIPVLVDAVMKIVNGVRTSPEITPAQKTVLDELAQRLDATNQAVQALEIREV
jgi:hypothetical protein